MSITCESPERRPSPGQESVSLPPPPDWDIAAHCDRSPWPAHLQHLPAHATFSSWLQGERAIGGLAYITAPGMCPPQLSSGWSFRALLWVSLHTGHCLEISPPLLRHSALPLYCCEEIVLIQENKEFLCCMDTYHPLRFLKSFYFVWLCEVYVCACLFCVAV